MLTTPASFAVAIVRFLSDSSILSPKMTAAVIIVCVSVDLLCGDRPVGQGVDLFIQPVKLLLQSVLVHTSCPE